MGRVCVLTLALLVMGACGQPMLPVAGEPAGSSEPSPAPEPTASLAPTPFVAAEPTAAVAPGTPVPTEVGMPPAPGIVVPATASPFPTAGPATWEPGPPVRAEAHRGGLSLDVRMAKADYLAGEGGQAEVTLRNDGPEHVFFLGHTLTILDERGHEPDPWPWAPGSWPGYRRPGLYDVAPGQAISATLSFQVPLQEQAGGHTYRLWAATRFSLPAPGGQGPDNRWLRLETGPIPLEVTPPSASQQLSAALQVDHDGWRLQAHDAHGRPPAGPVWGAFEAVTPDGASAGPLRETSDGTWSGAWDEHMRRRDIKLTMRAWVAAPGYVTTGITETVAGQGDLSDRFGVVQPRRRGFASVEDAQASLAFPLRRPFDRVAGVQPEAVYVESGVTSSTGPTNVEQLYRLPTGGALRFIQMINTEQYTSAGWGLARFDPEARPVAVGTTPGYLIQHFGWWELDWKLGDVGFALHTPIDALSADDLLAIADSVRPAP